MPNPELTPYEIKRKQNIQDNANVLASLGLNEPLITGRPGQRIKRKATELHDDPAFNYTKRLDEALLLSPDSRAVQAVEREERRAAAVEAQSRQHSSEIKPTTVCPRGLTDQSIESCEVLQHADWRAWQLCFLSHNHVFDYFHEAAEKAAAAKAAEADAAAAQAAALLEPWECGGVERWACGGKAPAIKHAIKAQLWKEKERERERERALTRVRDRTIAGGRADRSAEHRREKERRAERQAASIVEMVCESVQLDSL
tara:strand:- start:1089 stop:1859 length:771 start_codon:yes stop_codon:yes gene_type:complete